jgi:6-phosphogluconolactonase
MESRTALYSANGEVLTHYEMNTEEATLIKRSTLLLPANVQFAWPHPSRQYLYVISSNRRSAPVANINHLTVLRIDPTSGALRQYGEPLPLRSRPIHICLDASGSYALIAYNNPSGVSVHSIDNAGCVGEEIIQSSELDCGIYPHQVLTMPSARSVIVVARGNDAAGDKPEDPGALKLFYFNRGLLTKMVTIAPHGGYGFGPRHVDFHPQQPWLYVSLERQNKLLMFRMQDELPEQQAAFIRDSLKNPQNVRPRQIAGTIRVHPNGRFVYIANRADWTIDVKGKQVFGGGENSIAVYAIDATTGEPSLIQHADPRSMHIRDFAFDRDGRILITSAVKPLVVHDGTLETTVHAGLSVFRVGEDGRLDFVRKYDIDTRGKMMYWMGTVGLY